MSNHFCFEKIINTISIQTCQVKKCQSDMLLDISVILKCKIKSMLAKGLRSYSLLSEEEEKLIENPWLAKMVEYVD